jgi:hypothetical protein
MHQEAGFVVLEFYYIGVVVAVVSCCFTVNIHTHYFYTFAANPIIFPGAFYKEKCACFPCTSASDVGYKK